MLFLLSLSNSKLFTVFNLNPLESLNFIFISLYYVGAVELEKLPLKKDALKKLNLPFTIKSGNITGLIISRTPLVVHNTHHNSSSM